MAVGDRLKALLDGEQGPVVGQGPVTETQVMISPAGDKYDVPVDQVTEARKAGLIGMLSSGSDVAMKTTAMMKDKDGNVYDIPEDQINDAMNAGLTYATHQGTRTGFASTPGGAAVPQVAARSHAITGTPEGVAATTLGLPLAGALTASATPTAVGGLSALGRGATAVGKAGAEFVKKYPVLTGWLGCEATPDRFINRGVRWTWDQIFGGSK